METVWEFVPKIMQLIQKKNCSHCQTKLDNLDIFSSMNIARGHSAAGDRKKKPKKQNTKPVLHNVSFLVLPFVEHSHLLYSVILQGEEMFMFPFFKQLTPKPVA